ncbi:hypothetical protein B0H13DRAFT_2689818 [Mycena leptocephala]|nr:hypothetical protein B0H13DRAFT_2689818 [Mycena leptocephala]
MPVVLLIDTPFHYTSRFWQRHARCEFGRLYVPCQAVNPRWIPPAFCAFWTAPEYSTSCAPGDLALVIGGGAISAGTWRRSYVSLRARVLFAAQNIRPRGAGPSGSPTPPAHAKSPFSFDDPCSTQPMRHPRSVRSSISMTSISIQSLRPGRHHAFNVPGAQAAPAHALPLDFANVPLRVACESQPVRAYLHGLRWGCARVTPSRRYLNAYYLLYHSPPSLLNPGAGVRYPILVILAALPLSLASASCQIVVVTDVAHAHPL